MIQCIIDKTIRLEKVTNNTFLTAPLVSGNSLAHMVRLRVLDSDGEPADLTGISATGAFNRPDGHQVTPINVTITGNVVECVFPASCYTTAGRFRFMLDLNETVNNETALRTAFVLDGLIEIGPTGSVVDPGTPVPNIQAAIANAQLATTAANTAAQTATTAAAAAQDVADNVEGEVSALKSATEQIADETGIVFITFAVGSFENTDGKNYIESANRIRINEYIDLDEMVSVSQQSGYGLYYYLYDANMTYIDKSAQWRTSTTPITTENLRRSWANAKYMHILMRKNDNSNLILDDKSKMSLVLNNKTNKDKIEEIKNAIHNILTPNAMPVRIHVTRNQNQGIVKVKNEFWVFTDASDDHTSYAGKIYVFNNAFDNYPPTIHYHNLGHASSLFYNSFCDCLFVSNVLIDGVGGIGYFKNASQKTNLYINDSDFVFIPINTITGRSYTITQGDAWNTIYIIYQNTLYHYLMKTDSNNTFDGEIILLDNQSFPATNETVQGIIYTNGKFMRMTGVEDTSIDIIAFIGNALEVESNIIINSYSTAGNAYKLEPEGIVADGETLYITQWDRNTADTQFWIKKIQ